MLSILNSLLSLWIFMIPLVVAVALDSIYRIFSNESKKRGVNLIKNKLSIPRMKNIFQKKNFFFFFPLILNFKFF
jgi:hypothetical protein